MTSGLNIVLKLLEKWRSCLNLGFEVFGVFLSDFSKAFDCFLHESLAAKLNAYGTETLAVHLITDYTANEKQSHYS